MLICPTSYFGIIRNGEIESIRAGAFTREKMLNRPIRNCHSLAVLAIRQQTCTIDEFGQLLTGFDITPDEGIRLRQLSKGSIYYFIVLH
jgi:hypothetical protein